MLDRMLVDYVQHELADARFAQPPRINRVLICFLSICLALASFSCKPTDRAQVSADELNVLLITLDTTRADHIGCYGHATARTPNLDKLAHEGTRFSRCSTCVSLTLPAHSSIMTGNYPFVHGVRKNGTSRLADANTTLAERLHIAGFATQAVVASFVLNRMFGIAQGFDEYSDVSGGDSAIALHAERRGDEIASEAITRLEHLANKRFFLWVHFFDPHYPYVSPGKGVVETFDAYDDEIAFMDGQIGFLLEALRVLNLDNRTLVVIVGDHGESLGEHGEYQHGYFTYETTLHVPLIMWCPGRVPAGQAVAAQVRTIDVAPTILDLLNLPSNNDVQGVSLVGVLNDGAEADGREAYAESFEAHDQFALSRLRSVAIDGWKYILSPEPELYNLADDPHEQRNVIDDQPDIARDLDAALHDLIASAAPPVQEDTRIELSPLERARLEALGYTGASSTAGYGATTELERLAPTGANPNAYTEQMTAYSKAHWAMMMRDFPMAQSLLSPVVRKMPRAVRVRSDLAFVEQNLGKYDIAEKLYREAIEQVPNDGYLRRMYGGLLIRTRRWSDALDQLGVALAERSDDVEVLYNMSVALAELGRFGDAREKLQRVLTLDPRHVSSLHAMGAYYAREGRLTEAEEYFSKALAIDPTHARAQHDLQRLREQMNGD